MRFVFACLLIMAPILGGCSGVDHLGAVGDSNFYAVHHSKSDGPNFSALIVQQGADEDGVGGTVKVIQVFHGPGILTGTVPALVGAAAEVGSSAAYGLSLRPDKTVISAGGGAGNADSGSSSHGGSSSASAHSDQSQRQGQAQGQHQSQRTTNNNHNSNRNANHNRNSNHNRNANHNRARAGAHAGASARASNFNRNTNMGGGMMGGNQD